MRGRELGDGLRRVLARSGFSGRKLASLLGWDHVKLVDLLNGKLGVSEVELAALLGACHTPPAEHAHLLALYREANIKDLLQQHGSRLPINLRTLIEHENVAIEIINLQLHLVPGLLQTPDYMRVVISAPRNIPADELDARVEARLARQEIFNRDIKCTFFVHEQVLHLPVGGPDVMSDQLHHMIRMSVRTNIALRVVPTAIGAHAGLNGSFVLMKFSGIEPVVHIENQTSSLFIEQKEAVHTYVGMAKALDAVALGREESRRLINDIVA